MSRFAQRSRFVALGLFGVIALSVPASANATPARGGEACSPLASRTVPTCRVAARHRLRTATLDTQVLPVGIAAYIPSRYLSLLILGVGY